MCQVRLRLFELTLVDELRITGPRANLAKKSGHNPRLLQLRFFSVSDLTELADIWNIIFFSNRCYWNWSGPTAKRQDCGRILGFG